MPDKKPRTILEECEAFVALWEYGAADFSRRAVNDGSFLTKLRGGRSPSERTMMKVRAFMEGGAAKHSKAARGKPYSARQGH